MWFKYSNRYFGEIDNFAYGEINERSFSNPHPCHVTLDISGSPIENQWDFRKKAKVIWQV